MKGINPKAYYIVDISSLKEPRIYAQEFWGIEDALEVIESNFYNDFENTDIIRGQAAIDYGLKFKAVGYSSFIGQPRYYAFPYYKLTDAQAQKSFRTLVRRKMREDFLKDLPNFIKFLTENQNSCIRTFRLNSNNCIYYLVNSVPKYIKERYYKTVMDCIQTSSDYKRVALVKVKILECEEVTPITTKEFLGTIQDNIKYLLSKNHYHPALIKYEKLGLTASKYNLRGIYETTEKILPIRIDV